jgi:PleD family two-component response regulator
LTAIYEHHAQLEGPAIAPDASDSPLRVLVVDDHPAVRMGLRELLGRRGHGARRT